MTENAAKNILLAIPFCGLLSILNGGGILVALIFFILIVWYNIGKSEEAHRQAEIERNTKIVWSEKQQAFIRTPKEQRRWE